MLMVCLLFLLRDMRLAKLTGGGAVKIGTVRRTLYQNWTVQDSAIYGEGEGAPSVNAPAKDEQRKLVGAAGIEPATPTMST
jgi:hypothetical protein